MKSKGKVCQCGHNLEGLRRGKIGHACPPPQPPMKSRHECCGSVEEHYTSCPVIEIEENCVENNHAIGYSLIEDRAYPIICSKCTIKIERLEKK